MSTVGGNMDPSCASCSSAATMLHQIATLRSEVMCPECPGHGKMDVYVCIDSRRLSKHKLSDDHANYPEGQLRAAIIGTLRLLGSKQKWLPC